MGLLFSTFDVDVQMNGQDIAARVIRGLGGKETLVALSRSVEHLDRNLDHFLAALQIDIRDVSRASGQLVTTLDRTLLSLTIDVHDSLHDFSSSSGQLVACIDRTLLTLAQDIHYTLFCFRVLLAALAAFFFVLCLFILHIIWERRRCHHKAGCHKPKPTQATNLANAAGREAFHVRDNVVPTTRTPFVKPTTSASTTAASPPTRPSGVPKTLQPHNQASRRTAGVFDDLVDYAVSQSAFDTVTHIPEGYIDVDGASTDQDDL